MRCLMLGTSIHLPCGVGLACGDSPALNDGGCLRLQETAISLCEYAKRAVPCRLSQVWWHINSAPFAAPCPGTSVSSSPAQRPPPPLSASAPPAAVLLVAHPYLARHWPARHCKFSRQKCWEHCLHTQVYNPGHSASSLTSAVSMGSASSSGPVLLCPALALSGVCMWSPSVGSRGPCID